jgi:SAM-dependent methyltransferase
LIATRERRHPRGRERLPEPMIMDDPDSVAQFHAGGVASPGMQSVYDFSAHSLDALLPHGARLLDLGVGSGRALAYAMRLRPDLEATAVDLAPNMLATARSQFEIDGLQNRIELVQADITARSPLRERLLGPVGPGRTRGAPRIGPGRPSPGHGDPVRAVPRADLLRQKARPWMTEPRPTSPALAVARISVGRAASVTPRSSGRRPIRPALCWPAPLGCAN